MEKSTQKLIYIDFVVTQIGKKKKRWQKRIYIDLELIEIDL